jgi:HSP20 family molecular chaperone IbpA
MTRKTEDDPEDDATLTGRGAIEEIDRRLGGLLGPLAESLAKVVDAAEKAQAAGDASGPDDPRLGGLRVRTGLTVRSAAGGSASRPRRTAGRDPARPMTPSAAAAARTDADPTRGAHPDAETPPHDIHQTATDWSLTADMPGAAEHDLSIALENRMMTIDATGARRWRLIVEAPDWLTGAMLEPTLNNGVLTLQATRPAGEAS